MGKGDRYLLICLGVYILAAIILAGWPIHDNEMYHPAAKFIHIIGFIGPGLISLSAIFLKVLKKALFSWTTVIVTVLFATLTGFITACWIAISSF